MKAMFTRKKPATAGTWAAVRAELQRLRGHNLLRARVYEFERQNLIRLPLEARGEAPPAAEVQLHLTADPSDLWAEVLPGGERLEASAFEGDLRQFMAALAARVRQRPYLRTAAKTASYRPQVPPPEDAS